MYNTASLKDIWTYLEQMQDLFQEIRVPAILVVLLKFNPMLVVTTTVRVVMMLIILLFIPMTL